MFPRDAFEEVADPALLLLLRSGQEEQLFGSRHVIVYFAGYNNLLLSVQVVFVALGVAATALEGRWGLENMPQGPSASLTAGGKVVESEDELMSLMADVGGTISIRCWFNNNLLVTFTLGFIGIQDLKYPWNFFGVSTVHISVSDRSDMKQFINVQGHERVCLLTVPLTVVEEDLLTAHHNKFSVPAKAFCVLGRK